MRNRSKLNVDNNETTDESESRTVCSTMSRHTASYDESVDWNNNNKRLTPEITQKVSKILRTVSKWSGNQRQSTIDQLVQ